MQLELIWRIRSGGGGRTEQRYLDFVIDGQSLGTLLHCGDMIGCLGWGRLVYEAEMADVLLLKKPSPLETGRVMLYVCPECGDIGCGAITALVEQTEDYFVWRDFGYENDYDPELPGLTEYIEVGPFRFGKAEYQQVLRRRQQDVFVDAPIDKQGGL